VSSVISQGASQRAECGCIRHDGEDQRQHEASARSRIARYS
jgi:hypothetical protein